MVERSHRPTSTKARSRRLSSLPVNHDEHSDRYPLLDHAARIRLVGGLSQVEPEHLGDRVSYPRQSAIVLVPK
jgi:hypothetical protein